MDWGELRPFYAINCILEPGKIKEREIFIGKLLAKLFSKPIEYMLRNHNLLIVVRFLERLVTNVLLEIKERGVREK